ncbi:hypothetical protein RCL_jg26181.t1 [Rhizophagus clarus]|uniref:Uncharacterized protein n=1 Tax=Rhizophagus clarus TaxID=94130 RepID=A0A8H3KTE9_9GLOM|nr:hypothetical protein RCL_jg26181.t1 [Rhizophagus clarus]
MNDSESISNNDDIKILINDFIESIPDNSDLSDDENDDSYSYNMSSSTLTLVTNKNNPDSLIFITTFVNEYFGYDLNAAACHFEASKTFTKPMLKDIEWVSIYDHLKPLAIKCILKVKYNKKVYNQDFYKN